MAYRQLYLVRHGAYDPDPAEPVDGGSLNETGRQQASLLADRLADIQFDAMHHSTALRAVQTADVLTFKLANPSWKGDDLLRECIPTVPDGRDLTEMQREFFAQLPQSARQAGPVQAQAAIDRYTTPTTADTRELIVSHGNLINYFVSHALESPPHGWLRPVDYHCGLTIIRYNTTSPPRLIAYNDVGHLPPGLRGIEYPQDLRA